MLHLKPVQITERNDYITMRSCGILLHITSLPSKYGIGTLGKEAFKFVDFLKKAGHRYWQILPIGPTTIGDSPYQSFSAFAGNPLMIDFDLLVEEGLLSQENLENLNFGSNCEKVDYKLQFETKYILLKRAYRNFISRGENKDFIKFINQEQAWLEDYSMYMALKYKFNQLPWNNWENGVKFRGKEVLDQYKVELNDEIGYWNFIQFIFYSQWTNLKNYANKQGIRIIGDIPIYVSYDSADVWSSPELFMLDKDLLPSKVAGFPPDDIFSKTGQLWGNPIYNWDELKSIHYKWWIDRLRHSLKIYDVLRIDHFRGFDSFYAIPYKDKTAEFGEWLKAPGKDFFGEVKKQLGELPIIAENLGFITDSVNELLEYTGYSGMKVMEFGFNQNKEGSDMPHNFSKKDIAYLGTHDNDTCLGYLKSLDDETLAFLKKYVNADSIHGAVMGMIRSLYSSVSDVVIIQMQDFLSIGSEGRMNYPSSKDGNWTWRMKPNVLSSDLAQKMYEMASTYFRSSIK